MSFPIIDISHIQDSESQLRLAQEITDACSKWGFLLVKGHPIPTADIEEMFSLSKEFFSLPEDQKSAYPITSKIIGYMGSFKDRHNDDKMSMWFAGAPGALEENQSMLHPFWRQHIQTVEAFRNNCHNLIVKLLECFAIALHLDPKFFVGAHKLEGNDSNSLRMLMYPARSEKPSFEGVGSRMAEHTDSGSVTLLFQHAPGLEVLSPEGQWVKAPHMDDCILVNLGDALSFWSSHQLKATFHRVTFDGLPHDRERQSMAYFAKASPETVLWPIKSDGNQEKYYSNGHELKPGITVGELTKIIIQGIYSKPTKTTSQRGGITAAQTPTAVS